MNSLKIEGILGVNSLYKPIRNAKSYSKSIISFPCTIKIPNEDATTIKEIKDAFNKVIADHTKNPDKLNNLLKSAKEKFYSGNTSKFIEDRGHYILKCSSYDTQPATGRIINGKLHPEIFTKETMGKEKGYIKRGDKIMAALNIYVSRYNGKLMIKLIGCYQQQKFKKQDEFEKFKSKHKLAADFLNIPIAPSYNDAKANPYDKLYKNV